MTTMGGSGWPLGRVASIASLGQLGRTIATNNGQSDAIYELDRHPGFLFKQYKSFMVAGDDASRLDGLTGLLDSATAAERELLGKASSWPRCRVVRGNETIGVVLPRAPDIFKTEFTIRSGRTTRDYLEIDWLAQPKEACDRRGLPWLSFSARLSVVRDIVRIAEFCERNGVVYGDWSYANAFCSFNQECGYVIDIDGASFGPRPQIFSHMWEDPLAGGAAVTVTPVGSQQPTDTLTDRFGVALLAARCLAAQRDTNAALQSLYEQASRHKCPKISALVRQAILADKRKIRPRVATLLGEIEQACSKLGQTGGGPTTQPGGVPSQPGANVSSWRSVNGKIGAAPNTGSGSAQRRPAGPPSAAPASGRPNPGRATPPTSRPRPPVPPAAVPVPPPKSGPEGGRVASAGGGGMPPPTSSSSGSASAPRDISAGQPSGGFDGEALFDCLMILVLLVAVGLGVWWVFF